jgi:membrane dipeptidase
MTAIRCLLLMSLVISSTAYGQATTPDGDQRYTFKENHDPNGIGKFYLGREIAYVMGFAGVNWLERDSREREEKLMLMVESLDLKEGDVVADIGCGSGVISRLMARKVGDTGRIMAVDVQDEMLNRLKENLDKEGIENVTPVKGTQKTANLKPNSIDLAIMVDVYHEFEFPYEMLKAISDALKPGGRVCFVEYRKEDPKVPIKLVHKMTEKQVIKEASQAGLNLKWQETVGVLPQQHMVFCTKQGEPATEQRPPIKLTQKAIDLHNSCLVVDGHNDLPWTMRAQADSNFDKVDIAKPTKFHTDIPRLKKGNVGAQFWSVFVPVSTMETRTAAQATFEQIELTHRMIKRYPGTFHLALTTSDVEEARKQGKIASMIGMEGGHSIENNIGLLRKFYAEGARYMTLTHSKTLDWADACTDEARHGGLTEFGEEVVRTMNELGMLVDISHVSPDCMKDAIRVSTAPVIASHSSARAVADHVRNVPDDVLRLLPQKDGVIMVNYYSGFVVPANMERTKKIDGFRKELEKKYGSDTSKIRREERKFRDNLPMDPGTIHDVLDHIEHIIKVAGINHVGLGSDYDGIGMLPKQLEDVTSYPLITQGLMDRGYSDEDIRKVLGENLMRVWKKAEIVAKEMQSAKNE